MTSERDTDFDHILEQLTAQAQERLADPHNAAHNPLLRRYLAAVVAELGRACIDDELLSVNLARALSQRLLEAMVRVAEEEAPLN